MASLHGACRLANLVGRRSVTSQQTVIVTGGTHGIGRDVSLDLANNGHNVVAIGIDSPDYSSVTQGSVSSLKKEATERSLDMLVIEADVSRSADVQMVVENTLEHFGPINALVNNAAIGPLGNVLETTEEMFDRIIQVNLKGAYLSMRAVLTHMVENGGGSIINIGSGAGWGKPNMAAYASSKGGLAALSASTAYDFFHKKIRVNTVIPGGGGIVSGITLDRFDGDFEWATQSAVGSAAGRPVNGHDVTNVVEFLIDEGSAAISGTTIDVGCFSHQGGPVPRKGHS